MKPEISTENEMTTAQKTYLTGLLAKAEFDPKVCTLFHTRLAEEAAIDSPRPRPGDRVDDWLQTITKRGAARLITRLKELTE